MTIEKQLIEAMLAYADDIVPVNRQEIIDFFESKNVPYRQDHVDYLARFGGSNPAFIKKSGIDSSFEMIKDVYIENHPDMELLSGFCHFSINVWDDNYCIEQSTGIIYRADETDDGKPTVGEMVSGDITSSLFLDSLFFLEKIAIKINVKENISVIDLASFREKHKKYLIDIKTFDMEYYLKGDTFYCLSTKEYFLMIYKLNIAL